MASHGQFQPATQGIAVDGGNDRFLQRLDLVQQRLPAKAPSSSLERAKA